MVIDRAGLTIGEKLNLAEELIKENKYTEAKNILKPLLDVGLHKDFIDNNYAEARKKARKLNAYLERKLKKDI